MGKLTLYGNPMSTCTRRVLCALAEKGVDFEFKVVDLMKGEHKHPDFIARQPFGQIPVLYDDDFCIYESRAIVRYIDESIKSGNSLMPSDAKARGLVEQWISVEMSHYKACDELVFELLFKKLFGYGEADPSKVDASSKNYHSTLAILEKHLEHSKFLVGDHFSIADLVYLPYTEYLLSLDAFKNVFDKYPHVKKWWHEISSRPSWKKATGK